jgi:hypothetical protein
LAALKMQATKRWGQYDQKGSNDTQGDRTCEAILLDESGQAMLEYIP